MAAGIPKEQVRKDYYLRSSDADEVNCEFSDVGFLRIVPDRARAGDMLLVQAGPGQLHVVILTPDGFIHADAGVRRVVEVPGHVEWPILSAWRHPDAGPAPESRPNPCREQS